MFAFRPHAEVREELKLADTRSFFRIARSVPPADEEYLTLQERRGDPPADASDEVKRSWNALSAFDSEDGARRLATRRPRLGTFVVRYDIPVDAGIIWEKTLGPGHYDLRGDRDELKRYLSDFVAAV